MEMNIKKDVCVYICVELNHFAVQQQINTALQINYVCARSVVSNSLRPQGLSPAMLFCPWDFSGKNTRVGCHFLLQEIFLAQGSNLRFLHCRWILYHWAPREAIALRYLEINHFLISGTQSITSVTYTERVYRSSARGSLISLPVRCLLSGT